MEEKVYAVYSEAEDMTFIMKDVYMDGEPKSTEVVGFYFGESTEENTTLYTGKLKAEF